MMSGSPDDDASLIKERELDGLPSLLFFRFSCVRRTCIMERQGRSASCIRRMYIMWRIAPCIILPRVAAVAPCRVWAEPSVLFRTVQQVARCSARLILRNARASGLRPSKLPAPQRAYLPLWGRCPEGADEASTAAPKARPVRQSRTSLPLTHKKDDCINTIVLFYVIQFSKK